MKNTTNALLNYASQYRIIVTLCAVTFTCFTVNIESYMKPDNLVKGQPWSTNKINNPRYFKNYIKKKNLKQYKFVILQKLRSCSF